MPNRLVSYGEFTSVMTNHFRLNFNCNEFFAVVNLDFYSNHLGQNN